LVRKKERKLLLVKRAESLNDEEKVWLVELCPKQLWRGNSRVLIMKEIKTIRGAQKFVKDFAERNNWKDVPNIDKFDHLHEELLEMSQHLRYKDEEERIKFVHENKEIFIDGMGDLFFAMCRLANQLDVDVTEAFNQVKDSIVKKYDQKSAENKMTRKRKLTD